VVLGTDNEGAALVGGSLFSPGGKMKTVKLVVTWKGVFVKTESGSILAHAGDVVEAPENEAKILLGLKRARMFDPAIDEPPPPLVEPVEKPEPEPVQERKPTRKKKGE
jgi:hypothetical protein